MSLSVKVFVMAVYISLDAKANNALAELFSTISGLQKKAPGGCLCGGGGF